MEDITTERAEFHLELMKKDHFDTKAKEQASVSQVTKLLKDITVYFSGKKIALQGNKQHPHGHG